MEVEDLLQKAAALFPAYLRDLLALLTGPKRFVARQQADKSSLEHATLFLAISVAINFVLKLPLAQENPAWEILRTAAFSFVVWLSAGLVIWIAHRVVGGAGALDGTLAIAFYYFGVLEYLISITALLLVGSLRTIDPASFEAMSKAVREGQLMALINDAAALESTGMRVAMTMAVAGALATLAWLLAGWGGFRAAHKLGGGRSAAAFVVAVVLWVPLSGLTLFVASALVASP